MLFVRDIWVTIGYPDTNLASRLSNGPWEIALTARGLEAALLLADVPDT